MPDYRHRPERPENVPLTITTVLYNSAASLPGYASALTPIADRGEALLIGVDNASPDNSATVFSRLFPRSELLRNSSNLGFAAACNRAWPRVRSPYWLLLNPDVEVPPRGLEALVGWMDHHPSVGLASPLLRSAHGRPIPVARPHDSLWRPIAETLRLHKLAPERVRQQWLLSGRSATPEIIRGWVPGAALIARAEAVAQVGLLDERLFLYGEDREWCWRMAKGGWEIGVCSDVEFIHVGGSSASATWTEEERVGREVAGHLTVTRKIHGDVWARIFAFSVAISLRAESLDPRRDLPQRADNRRRSALYMRASMTTSAAEN